LDELLTGEIGLRELPGKYHSHAAPNEIRTVVNFSRN
jgi:hypothetical protein